MTADLANTVYRLDMSVRQAEVASYAARLEAVLRTGDLLAAADPWAGVLDAERDQRLRACLLQASEVVCPDAGSSRRDVFLSVGGQDEAFLAFDLHQSIERGLLFDVVDDRFAIALSAHEAAALSHALDRFVRVRLGHFAEIADFWHGGMDGVAMAAMRAFLDEASAIARNAVSGGGIPAPARAAWDAHRVIGHRLALDRAGVPTGHFLGGAASLALDPPRQTGSDPLPEILRIQ